MSERGPPPDISQYGRALSALNSAATRPALVVVGSGALFAGDLAAAPAAPAAVQPQVTETLAALRSKGVSLALLAAVPPAQLQPLIDLHGLGPFAHTLYSSDGPAEALRGLRSQGGVQYSDILLYDADIAVVREGNRLGAVSHLTRSGLNVDVLRDGLERFEELKLDARGF